MNLLLLAALLGPVAQMAEKPVVIGTHFTDGLAGLAVYRDANESVLLDLGWVGKGGKQLRGYKALVDAKVHFGEAAPDDSYHRICWSVGATTVTYEWGIVSPGEAVGRVCSTAAIEIEPRFSTSWSESNAQAVEVDGNKVMTVGGLTVVFKAKGGPRLTDNSVSYLTGPDSPLQFSIGANTAVDPAKAEAILATARKRYNAGRLWAEGDWGDFVSPFENQLGNTKIYSADTGRLAHIVSRGWCLPDGQVLFCWDSFFNGLMSSLEDPKGARKTLRAILAAATPEGFVPNYAGRGWGVSSDRSQPPVGSYCIWKVHQRDPDIAFLKEAYPKLLKWHRWWFSPRGAGKSPTRDGNRDGLLEWGSTTGDLQNAKYESGLDDSPMFDDEKMVGPSMDLDSTDLSALWAMDAEYLARIADAIGKTDDAAHLRKEREDMARRMDNLLWNEKLAPYCYRYWTPKRAVKDLKLSSVFSSGGEPGFKGKYFQGRELKGDAVVRHDADIDFNWAQGPLPGFGPLNYSVRWTADFTAPKAGPYTIQAESDDGCRVWIEDKKVIDGWSVHPSVKYEAPVMLCKAGEKHSFRMEYFQAEGGAQASLKVRRIVEEAPAETFYPRLSPLNFYPLMVDSPSKERARRTLDLFFRTDQFGGQYVCPTISKSDPAYPAQGYWRGTVWGPTSYLTFQGLRRYATTAEMTDYAGKSVALFMKNWKVDGSCHENFNSITGWGRSDPHYTWGALLCLVGLEQLCDIDNAGRVVLNGASGRHIKVHNLRLGGRLYDLTVEPNRAILRLNGKPVAVAVGKVTHIKL